MTFLKRLFGSLKISDRFQTPNAMLHADDWTSWKQHKNREKAPLGPWVRKNIVHAMESCPKVLAYWKLGQLSDSDERVPYYVGLALEDFSDEQKTAFLSGVCNGKAQTSLFKYINKKASNWTVLSPAWIGPPGSDLRRAVVNCGCLHRLGYDGHTDHNGTEWNTDGYLRQCNDSATRIGHGCIGSVSSGLRAHDAKKC